MRFDKKNIIGFIDVATTKIVVMICGFSRDNVPSFLGYSETENKGFKNGDVINYTEFSETLNSVIETAENKAGLNISDVVISLSGLRYRSNFFQSELNFPFETTIQKHHIKDSADAIQYPESFDRTNNTIVHVNPVSFVVDGDNFVDNPEGMFVKSLHTTYQVITVNSAYLQNLISVFKGLSLNVKKVVVNSYSSAISTLVDDEKSLGSLVIDIGTSTMYLSLFAENKFIFNTSLPSGTNILNQHFMRHLNISFSEAERLKRQYGVTRPEGMDFSKEVAVFTINENGTQDRDCIRKSDLLNLSYGTMISVAENIKSKFPPDALSHINKIILTGGGARTIDIDKVFAEVFNCSVRVANPLTMDIFGDKFNMPEYATIIGMFIDYMDSLKHPVLKVKDIKRQNLIKKIKLWYNKYFG